MSSPTIASHSLREPDPFPYGWRYVTRRKPDGTVEVDLVPLTLLDALHPQEGDQIPENSQHEKLRTYFSCVFQTRLALRANVLCLCDCPVDWDREDLRGHSPDLIVLERDQPWPWRKWSTLHVKREGARPLLIIEVVSPSTRANDVVTKVEHYHRAGVPLYVIVDQVGDEGPLQLVGYRWQAHGYESLPLDAAGRLLLESFGVSLVVVGDRVAILDAATGQEIGDYAAITHKLEAAERARQEEAQARAAAERARQEEAQARTAAERARQEEAQARAAAERRQREEAQARAAAEQGRAEAEKARIEAERHAQEQLQARLALEARLKELEARLQQSGGQTG